MDIGDRKQLFVDQRLVASSRGLATVMHPARKEGFVLLPEQPAEQGRLGPYGSVVRDGGELKMWYWGMERRDTSGGRRALCLATSTDGAQWERPPLGLVERGGSKANNVVAALGDTVAPNPVGAPEERFVLLQPQGWDEARHGGLFISFSGDGILWHQHTTRLFPFIPDTQNQVRYDARLGNWVAYLRVWDPDRRVGRIDIDDLRAPWPYDTTAEPYYIWGRDHMPVPRHEVPTVFATDGQDPADCDVYTPVVVEYPWADEVYLMFPSLYQHFPNRDHGGRFNNDGLMDIHLAVSRDGVTWTRPCRRPYLPLGRTGERDSKLLYMLAGLVRVGDVIHHYYTGFDISHGAYSATPALHSVGAVGHATQRLDGFVSLQAEAAGGELVTPPLTFSGDRLELNLATAAAGCCRVELRDEAGRPLPGYGYADCDPLRGNDVAALATWQAAPDLSGLAGQPVQVAIELANGDLFALQFRS